jgi:DNA-directed RNA polymerase sigma subunit (sigma70/sigma32)
MYRHNVTDIDQLARIYGITRKRVRQIVTKPETADASK